MIHSGPGLRRRAPTRPRRAGRSRPSSSTSATCTRARTCRSSCARSRPRARRDGSCSPGGPTRASRQLARRWRARRRATGSRSCDDVGDAELDGLYRSATALVLPSRYEGFGFTPLEAMARGCPVLASDIPPIREVSGDGALLAPLDDERGLGRGARPARAATKACATTCASGARETVARYSWDGDRPRPLPAVPRARTAVKGLARPARQRARHRPGVRRRRALRRRARARDSRSAAARPLVLAAFPGASTVPAERLRVLHGSDWRESRAPAAVRTMRATSSRGRGAELERRDRLGQAGPRAHEQPAGHRDGDLGGGASRAGVPVVHTLHDYHLLCPRTTLLRPDGSPCRPHPALCGLRTRRLARWAPRGRRGRSASRDFVLERHAALFPDAPQHDDPARRSSRPAAPPAPPPERLRALGYLGALDPVKGVDRLLEAAATLARRDAGSPATDGCASGWTPRRRSGTRASWRASGRRRSSPAATSGSCRPSGTSRARRRSPSSTGSPRAARCSRRRAAGSPRSGPAARRDRDRADRRGDPCRGRCA